MTARGKNSSAGFTLLEVLVALAVLGIGVGACLKAVVLSQDGLIQAQTVDTALGLAEAKLAEVEAAGPARWMLMSGDFGQEHPGYRWQLEVKPVRNKSLLRVRMQVVPPDDNVSPIVLERLSWSR